MKIAPPKCDPKRVRGALVCMACNMMQADGRSREFDCRPSADFGAARALHGVHLPQAKRRGVPKSNSNRSKGFCKNRGRKCIDEDEQNCGVNEKSANHWSNVVNFGFGSHLGPREYSLKRWPIRKRATQLIKPSTIRQHGIVERIWVALVFLACNMMHTKEGFKEPRQPPVSWFWRHSNVTMHHGTLNRISGVYQIHGKSYQKSMRKSMP